MASITRDRKPVSVFPLSAGAGVYSLLSLLVLVGVAAGFGRLYMGLGATTGLSDGTPWGIWIAFDFLLIAFSGAGFTLAALVHVLRREKYHAAVRPAVLAGLAGYSAVLLILLLDLGRFDRFYHFLIFWNPHSPLFEICWCVLLYTTVLAVEVSPALFQRLRWARPRRWVERVMLPVAIAGATLSSLHQSTLGTLYLNMPHRLHPLWYTPLLPALFFVSSIMAGLGLAIFAYRVAARLRGEVLQPDLVRGLARGAAWMALLYLFLKLGDLAARGQLPVLLAGDGLSLLLWLELGLGALLPVALMFLPATRAREQAHLAAAALFLLGVFVNRFNATLFAQSVPVPAASYVPHIFEWLTTLGIIAGALLAWYLGVCLLPIFERKYH